MYIKLLNSLQNGMQYLIYKTDDRLVDKSIDLLSCQIVYEGVSKSFRTGCLERELQVVHLSLSAIVSLFCEPV